MEPRADARGNLKVFFDGIAHDLLASMEPRADARGNNGFTSFTHAPPYQLQWSHVPMHVETLYAYDMETANDDCFNGATCRCTWKRSALGPTRFLHLQLQWSHVPMHVETTSTIA